MIKPVDLTFVQTRTQCARPCRPVAILRHLIEAFHVPLDSGLINKKGTD